MIETKWKEKKVKRSKMESGQEKWNCQKRFQMFKQSMAWHFKAGRHAAAINASSVVFHTASGSPEEKRRWWFTATKFGSHGIWKLFHVFFWEKATHKPPSFQFPSPVRPSRPLYHHQQPLVVPRVFHKCSQFVSWSWGETLSFLKVLMLHHFF